MLLWPFNEAEFNFLNSSPDVWLDANLFLSSTDCSFDPRAWFLLWYALSAVRPFIKTCVPFQIIPIQSSTGYLHSKFSNTYKQYECSWAKFQLSQIRVWVNMQWNNLSILFLINLQRCQKTFIFLLYHYSVWSVDWCGKKSNLKQFNIRQQNKTWKKWRGVNTFARHCISYLLQ